MKKAVILSSGGLDSTTCMAVAVDQGFEPIALSFDYGQRHRIELDAAQKVGAHYQVQHHFVTPISLFRDIGGSALTDDIEVPKSSSVEDLNDEIPVTYVPARNTVFLSYGLAWAEVLGVRSIFIGVNAVDYSGYPDCRPAFIEAFEKLANLATKVGVEGETLRIQTPLIDLSKAEIVRQGAALGIDYGLTVSCYQATDDGLACGKCDSCRLRREGFVAAGLQDPTRYQ